MALNTYATLKTGVANWLARSNLTTYIPDFITLAHARIHYGSSHPRYPSLPLRIRPMEARRDFIAKAAIDGGTAGGTANAITVTPDTAIAALAVGLTVKFTAAATNTGTTTFNPSGLGATALRKGDGTTELAAGDILIGAAYTAYYDGSVFRLVAPGMVPLPSDFLQPRSIYLDQALRQKLEPISPQQADAIYAGTTLGEPKFYAVEGDYLRIIPWADGTYYGKLLYYRTFTALSGDSDTNWLLTNHPGIYLYGALLEAAPFIRNDDRLPMWFDMFGAAVNGLQAADNDARMAGGPLTMRTDVGNP